MAFPVPKNFCASSRVKVTTISLSEIVRCWTVTRHWKDVLPNATKVRPSGSSPCPLPVECLLALGIALMLLLGGCTLSTMTNPPRSVTEQLLLSTAADRAINAYGFFAFAQKKVYVDGSYLESYDSKYVLGTVRDALSRAGACLVDTMTNSEIVVEPRSGALSIDSGSSLLGLPQIGAPSVAGSVGIPEIAIYKSTRQHAIAKLALLAYSTKTGERFFSSGTLFGDSYNKEYSLLLGLLEWYRTDIPERKRK